MPIVLCRIGNIHCRIGNIEYEIQCSPEARKIAKLFLAHVKRRFESDNSPRMPRQCSIFLPFGRGGVHSKSEGQKEIYTLRVPLPPGSFALDYATNSLKEFVHNELSWSHQVSWYSSLDTLICADPFQDASREEGPTSCIFPLLVSGLNRSNTQGVLLVDYLLWYLDACHDLLRRKLEASRESNVYA